MILTVVDESIVVLFVCLSAIALARENNGRGSIPFPLRIEVKLDRPDGTDSRREKFLQTHYRKIIDEQKRKR